MLLEITNAQCYWFSHMKEIFPPNNFLADILARLRCALRLIILPHLQHSTSPTTHTHTITKKKNDTHPPKLSQLNKPFTKFGNVFYMTVI